MPMHYMEDAEDEENDFPMMAKRKMMKMMKAKKMGEEHPEMEKEMSLIKVEIKIGDSNGKKDKS
jgi:hypothetical protein